MTSGVSGHDGAHRLSEVAAHPPPSLQRQENLWVGRFFAMASPCEVLFDTDDPALAQHGLMLAVQEVQRIERKYSRYLPDSLISRLARHAGQSLPMDEETHRLFVFADQLYHLSQGLFDISSGALRRAWRFDGGTGVPSPAQIQACLPHIGWPRVQWNEREICLPSGMELDLGGIGKEYAVDRVFQLLREVCAHALLVNLGGDLRAQGPRRSGEAWVVGIENPQQAQTAERLLQIETAALATSGTSKRFVQAKGVRYGHLLNPKTGWPIASGVQSVTVLAESCTTAGMLTSLSLLAPQGAHAFLAEQSGVRYWVA